MAKRVTSLFPDRDKEDKEEKERWKRQREASERLREEDRETKAVLRKQRNTKAKRVHARSVADAELAESSLSLIGSVDQNSFLNLIPSDIRQMAVRQLRSSIARERAEANLELLRAEWDRLQANRSNSAEWQANINWTGRMLVDAEKAAEDNGIAVGPFNPMLARRASDPVVIAF